MSCHIYSGVYSVDLCWGWTPKGYEIWFFSHGFGLPRIKAVVDDFGSLVVVP